MTDGYLMTITAIYTQLVWKNVAQRPRSGQGVLLMATRRWGSRLTMKYQVDRRALGCWRWYASHHKDSKYLTSSITAKETTVCTLSLPPPEEASNRRSSKGSCLKSTFHKSQHTGHCQSCPELTARPFNGGDTHTCFPMGRFEIAHNQLFGLPPDSYKSRRSTFSHRKQNPRYTWSKSKDVALDGFSITEGKTSQVIAAVIMNDFESRLGMHLDFKT